MNNENTAPVIIGTTPAGIVWICYRPQHLETMRTNFKRVCEKQRNADKGFALVAHKVTPQRSAEKMYAKYMEHIRKGRVSVSVANKAAFLGASSVEAPRFEGADVRIISKRGNAREFKLFKVSDRTYKETGLRYRIHPVK